MDKVETTNVAHLQLELARLKEEARYRDDVIQELNDRLEELEQLDLASEKAQVRKFGLNVSAKLIFLADRVETLEKKVVGQDLSDKMPRGVGDEST